MVTSVTQRGELESIYSRYASDPRFEGLRQEGINLVPGRGPLNPNIMLIGESPGAVENANRMPFVGRAGNNLTNILTDVGIDPYTVYMTNVVKYWPRPEVPGAKRYLSKDEIEASRAYLQEEIDVVDPLIVGLCGRFAVQAIYPDKTEVFADHGDLLDGRYVCLYHPAVLSYDKTKRQLLLEGYGKLKNYL